MCHQCVNFHLLYFLSVTDVVHYKTCINMDFQILGFFLRREEKIQKGYQDNS